MGTKVTISDFDSVENSSFITELNNAKDALADEFDEVLYRDGSFNMTGSLDMNSNRIFNLPAPLNQSEPLRLADAHLLSEVQNPNFSFVVNTLAAGASATLSASGTYPDITLTFGVPSGANGGVSDGTYGGVQVSGAGTSWNLVAGHVTLTRMANLPANTIIGNDSGAPAVPQALTAAEIATMLGSQTFNSIALTGTPTAPTTATTDSSTKIATTAYVNNLLASNLTRTIPVLATSMVARGTNGPGNSSSETATNKLNFVTHDFDQTTNEYVQFMIPMPKDWNEGTVTAQFIWRANSGAGSVVWGIQGVALSDDDIIDTAFGTAVTVTDALITTSDLMVSAYTGAITIANTPAAEDLVVFQIYRDAASGSDTLTGDARLVGVRLKYTTNAKDDS